MPQALSLIDLQAKKANAEKITCLTAYDATFAGLMDQAAIDIVLVGDSLGNVIQGQQSTLPVTIDDMAYHVAAVARGLSKAMLIGDLPFMSYATREAALENAARLMRAGAHMVKLEGGNDAILDAVRAITAQGVPVCGHLGLTPQSVHKLGGYRVQGRDDDGAQVMYDAALALQQAGADLLVLECVPSALAARVTRALDIPTIGIGAGPDCDGQVLVTYDLLGMNTGYVPKFVHNFLADTSGGIVGALKLFSDQVRAGEFPRPEHGYDQSQ